ncbi:NADPH:quinone reductase-like Zn-dependent oxidoreductase [Azorhizobium sp. AG788]|nr:NADPH:quinone reductase-like Zn-dependent oxidoreductase [Azorhizobium sp. AG788]
MTVQTMRGLRVSDYSGTSATQVAELPVPMPGPNEVLIRVGASALNFLDLLMIEGKYQVKPPLPFVPGRDLAGEIVAVGAEVSSLRIGQRVAAQPAFGAFAEYAVAGDHLCQPLPDAVDDVAGAASGIVLATIVGAIKLRGQLQPGQWILITGAAGGVGTAAVQYARQLGGNVVTVVSSEEKAHLVKTLGANVVLRSDLLGTDKTNIRDALKKEGIEGIDVVVDMVGGANVDGLLRSLNAGGRFVIVGFASGQIPHFPANYLLLKDLVVYGSSLDRLFRERDPALRQGILEAFDLLATGRMTAEVDSVLPFSRFADGVERLRDRRSAGKIVFRGF